MSIFLPPLQSLSLIHILCKFYRVVDQIIQYLMDHIRISLNGNALHILQAGNFDLFALNAPVSYTHLDVYKRQVFPPFACGK